jgi:hypothetical protein
MARRRAWQMQAGLAAVFLVASAACCSIGEPGYWNAGFRNDSNTAYTVNIGGRAEVVVPPRSQSVVLDSLMTDEALSADLYDTDCRRLVSTKLTRSEGLLVIDDRGSVTAEPMDAMESPSASNELVDSNDLVMVGGWACSNPGWYAVARNDSDQDVILFQAKGPHVRTTWLLPARSRTSLDGGSGDWLYRDDMMLTVSSSDCVQLASFGPLGKQTVVLIDAAGQVSLGSRADFWASLSAVAEVSGRRIARASPCPSGTTMGVPTTTP